MILKLRKTVKRKAHSLWLFKIITFLHIVLGCYCNIHVSRPIRFFLRLYCIFFCTALLFLLYLNGFLFRIPKNFLIVIYVLMVVFHLFNGDKYILLFFRNIKIRDKIIGFKNVSLITRYVYLLVFLNAILRTFVTIYQNTYSFNNPNMYGFNTICFLFISMDLSQSKVVIVFSIIHCRIKLLRKFLESSFVSIYVTERSVLDMNIRNLRKVLHYYDSLMDIMRSIDRPLQFVVIY